MSNSITKKNSIDQFMLPDLFGQKKEIYSNTIDLYDLIPKYYFGNNARILVDDDHKPHQQLCRTFVHNKTELKAYISPAIIYDKDNRQKSCLPSAREELVEEAVKKIIIDKSKAKIVGKTIKANVSIKEIKQELKKRGHEYKWTEIKEAMEICHKSFLKISNEKGRVKILASSTIFPSIYGAEDDIVGEESQYIISFHVLANDAILQGNFRLVNYKLMMQYKKPLTRWLHKRISHLYRQAAITSPYRIKLNTIIRDSGMTPYEKLANNLRELEKCFVEMQRAGVVEKYEIEKRFEGERKNKMTDALCSLWLTQSFCNDIKKANYFEGSSIADERFNDLRGSLAQEPFRFATQDVENIINKINGEEGLSVVKDAIDYTMNKIDKGSIKNPQAYLRNAIANKYRIDLFEGTQEIENENIVEIDSQIWHKAENINQQLKFDKFLSLVKSKIGDARFHTWFKLNLKEISDKILFLTDRNFTKQTLEVEFNDVIRNALEEVFGVSEFEILIKLIEKE
jgi:hypothetical protein